MAKGLLGKLSGSVKAGVRRRREGSATESPGQRNGGIVVTYAPESDGDPDPGEVVWGWVPYEEDASQGKDRPLLILGHDGPLVVGVPLSSKNNSHRNDASEWVEVGTGAWDSRGRPSFADTGRLLRFKPEDVRREGSALDRRAFDRVVDRVAEVHGWQDD